jgi:DNA-binding CsgD family transcriptional regulator
MIVERHDELRLLGSLLDGIGTDGGRVVLIRGEAGIGKSALVDAFVDQVADEAHVLLGSCDDLLTPQPLGPIWDVSRTETSLTGSLVADDRRAVMAALLDLLSRELRPSVLVIEDTQWAGEATLDVIKYLGRRIARTNALLILTYRDTEVDSDHPLRRVVGDLPPQHLTRVHLDLLSRRAVGELLADAPFDAENVMSLTDGNPLFVTEILASGVDSVPASIRDAVLTRAQKLSKGARLALDLISVIPGGAKTFLITAMIDTSDEELAEGIQQGLLRIRGKWVSFAHELQRRAVESELSDSERVHLNALVLVSLPSETDPARLIHHAAEAGDQAAIIELAPLAARAASAVESHREAVEHFRRLRPYVADIDPLARAEILDDWGREEYLTDSIDAVEISRQAVEVRRQVGDERSLARSLSFSARTEFGNNLVTESTLRNAREAVEILEATGPGPDLARSLGVNAFLTWIDDEGSETVLDMAGRALSMAEDSEDASAIVETLHVKGQIQFSRGLDGGMALLEMALDRATDADLHYDEVRALRNIAGMAGDIREVQRAIDFSRRARDTAARYEMRVIETDAQSMYAEFLMWTGDWSAAKDAATDVLGSNEFADALGWRVIGTILAREGKPGAKDALERMWVAVQGANILTALDPSAAALAEYMWLTGMQESEWIDRLKEILSDGIAIGTPWPSGAFMFWMWKLGLLESVPEGTLSFYRGIVEGNYQAEATFWATRGITYEQGLALMHGNDAERIEAVRLFEHLGAEATAARVRHSLAEDGVKVARGISRATRDHTAGLTARQAEVLVLVAEGKTNTEIADILFVSHRTVENHVSAVLLKLDTQTRDEAVEAATELGILSETTTATT